MRLRTSSPPRRVLLLDRDRRLWVATRGANDITLRPGPETPAAWRALAATGRREGLRRTLPLIVEDDRPRVATIALPRLGQRIRRQIEARRVIAAAGELNLDRGFVAIRPLPPDGGAGGGGMGRGALGLDPSRRPDRLALAFVPASAEVEACTRSAAIAGLHLRPLPPVLTAAMALAKSHHAQWLALHVPVPSDQPSGDAIDQILCEAGLPVFSSRRPLSGLTPVEAALDGSRAVRRHLHRHHTTPDLITLLIDDHGPLITPSPDGEETELRHHRPPVVAMPVAAMSGLASPDRGRQPGPLTRLALAALLDEAPPLRIRTFGPMSASGTVAARPWRDQPIRSRTLAGLAAAGLLFAALILPGLQAAGLVDEAMVAAQRNLMLATELDLRAAAAGGTDPGRLAAGMRVASALGGLVAMEQAAPVDLLCVLDRLAVLRPEGLAITGLDHRRDGTGPEAGRLTLEIEIARSDAAAADALRQRFAETVATAGLGMTTIADPPPAPGGRPPLTRQAPALSGGDTDPAGNTAPEGGPFRGRLILTPLPADAGRSGTACRPRLSARRFRRHAARREPAAMDKDPAGRLAVRVPRLAALALGCLAVIAADLTMALEVERVRAHAEDLARTAEAARGRFRQAEAAAWRLDQGVARLVSDPRPLFTPPAPGPLLRQLHDLAMAAGIGTVRLSLSDAPAEAVAPRPADRRLPHPPAAEALPRLRPVLVIAELTAPSDAEIRAGLAAMRAALPGRAVIDRLDLADRPDEGRADARAVLRFTTIDPGSLPPLPDGQAMDPLTPLLTRRDLAAPAIPPDPPGTVVALALEPSAHRRRLSSPDRPTAAEPPAVARRIKLDGIARGPGSDWRVWINGRRIEMAEPARPGEPVVEAVGRDTVSIRLAEGRSTVSLALGREICLGIDGILPDEVCP
ncbi:hypothetical protein P7L70_18975 [Tistrella mobilis]|uniref:hypothetical protein n=1 Tax=Tistrella mobilis TaxID=171437 RepID=UPI003558E872